MLNEFKNKPGELNINCTDPLGRTSLVIAIENESFELIEVLLECGIEVSDALLHAISEDYVEAVELLLEWEEKHHKEGEPYVSKLFFSPSFRRSHLFVFRGRGAELGETR